MLKYVYVCDNFECVNDFVPKNMPKWIITALVVSVYLTKYLISINEKSSELRLKGPEI